MSSLPAALVRSGRIELWLETRLPDEAARKSIFSERLVRLPSPLSSVDTEMLARGSRGLTGADLKAAVEDAKLLYAYDWTQSKWAASDRRIFLEAIATIRMQPPELCTEETGGNARSYESRILLRRLLIA